MSTLQLMHFLAPQFLHLAWLALIPLGLYLFRRQAKRVPVSTMLFFRSLAREHQESAWLRKVKRWLSLLLTLLVLLLGVLALARPSREAAGAAPGSVICIVDVSASMAASDGERTRLDQAKEALHDQLAQLPDGVVVSLIAAADQPEVQLSRSRNRRELARLIDGLSVLPVEGQTASALATAKRLAALDPPSQLWLVSDSDGSAVGQAAATETGLAPAPLVSEPGLRFINVALPAVTNAGITGFQLRKAPLARDRFEAFVRVSASPANAAGVRSTLEARIAGRVAQLRELDLAPGAAVSLILPLEGARGQLLELRLSTPGDVLGWDDAVLSPLPQLRPLMVAWIADKPDPFTELALGALVEAGRLEIYKSDPKAWPLKDKPDVFVFENWVPDTWPSDRPAVVLTPPKSSGPLKLRALPAPGLPHDSVRSVATEHPVLYGVATSRVAITQTALLDASSALETLWMAGNEPVLAAGESQGQRLVVSLCSPGRSEQLALLPSYPLLLGNALYWCAESSDALSELRPQRTGELLSVQGQVKWTAWDGRSVTSQQDSTTGSLLALHRIGAWEDDTGRTGSSILASTAETAVPRNLAPSVNEAAADSSKRLASSGFALPKLLLWLLLAVLVLESFLFHRRAVY